MKIVVWPRARVLACEHGFLQWSLFLEVAFKRWYGENAEISVAIERAVTQENVRITASGRYMVLVKLLESPPTRLSFEVTASVSIMHGIRAAQRRWRHRVRARGLVAVGMAWHERLGAGAGLGAIHGDLFRAIARWV